MRPAPIGRSPTQTDAEVWLTVMEADMRAGDWFDPDAGRVPLGEYARRWIAERPGLSPRTVTLYERLLRLHIEPDARARRPRGPDAGPDPGVAEGAARRRARRGDGGQVLPVAPGGAEHGGR